MLVFAHVGHILVDAPLFGGPVLLLLLALWISSRRQKRQAEISPDPALGDADRLVP